MSEASSQYEDRVETVYEVTISTPEDLGIVDEDELRKAIFQGCSIIDTEDAIDVERK